MEAFLVSTIAVAIGEIGDKTQLLALLLAVRFRRPWPIVAGIFVATICNHALAAFVGQWAAAHMSHDMLRWLLGLSFLAIALWALKPDDMDEENIERPGYGVFVLTCITFFFAEIGDKTQLATIALAARFQNLVPVLAGTTLGMMLADTPAVFLGKIASPTFPLKSIRMVAAAIFAVLGLAVLAGISPGL
jgi:putative Ca2+/H+ antiporter (TMEM165/GDT1 family)